MIQRIRLAEKNRRGDAGAASQPVRLVGAKVAPRTSDSIETEGRGGVVVGLWLLGPHDLDVLRTDTVVVNGDEYRIDGEIGRWRRRLSGRRVGCVAALVRGEG